MRGKPYKRKRGDFEVRVLSDGRVVMIGSDEALLEIARTLETNGKEQSQPMENKNGRAAGQTAG